MEVTQIMDSGRMTQIPYFGHTGFPQTYVFILLLSLLYSFNIFLFSNTFLYFT